MRSPRRPPALPTEQVRRSLTVRLPLGDAELLLRALHLTADRAEGNACRLRDLAPELHKRAARLCRIAAAIDMQAEGVRE